MAKVIGLSGPQGGGKTTLLEGLKLEGLHVDDFKVSRAVQESLGWETLSNVLDSVDTMIAFQEKVREVKLQREQENRDRADVSLILTERTFADIAAYTQLWSWELVHRGKWSIQDGFEFAISFVNKCAENQQVYSGNIILPAMPHVVWQPDPHRASREHQEFIAEELESFFARKHPKTVPLCKITEKTINGRVAQALEWIKKL